MSELSLLAAEAADVPVSLRAALLARTSEILIGFWIIVVIFMFMVAAWSSRSQSHERCVEALKDPGVSDVVRMSICTR